VEVALEAAEICLDAKVALEICLEVIDTKVAPEICLLGSLAFGEKSGMPACASLGMRAGKLKSDRTSWRPLDICPDISEIVEVEDERRDMS
jgi:hypothetical protein